MARSSSPSEYPSIPEAQAVVPKLVEAFLLVGVTLVPVERGESELGGRAACRPEVRLAYLASHARKTRSWTSARTSARGTTPLRPSGPSPRSPARESSNCSSSSNGFPNGPPRRAHDSRSIASVRDELPVLPLWQLEALRLANPSERPIEAVGKPLRRSRVVGDRTVVRCRPLVTAASPRPCCWPWRSCWGPRRRQPQPQPPRARRRSCACPIESRPRSGSIPTLGSTPVRVIISSMGGGPWSIVSSEPPWDLSIAKEPGAELARLWNRSMRRASPRFPKTATRSGPSESRPHRPAILSPAASSTSARADWAPPSSAPSQSSRISPGACCGSRSTSSARSRGPGRSGGRWGHTRRPGRRDRTRQPRRAGRRTGLDLPARPDRVSTRRLHADLDPSLLLPESRTGRCV